MDFFNEIDILFKDLGLGANDRNNAYFFCFLTVFCLEILTRGFFIQNQAFDPHDFLQHPLKIILDDPDKGEVFVFLVVHLPSAIKYLNLFCVFVI